MKNRKLLMVLSLLLALTISLTGTLAYLTDTDSAVNIMTLGNVKIEHYEKDAAGNDFKQSQPLYPVYENGTERVGAIDKIVTVKNTGSSAAFVRTWIAFELGEMDQSRFEKVIHAEFGGTGYTLSNGEIIEIEGVKYYTVCATYTEALAAGKTSAPSLKQVYMDTIANNDDVAKFGETYEILVFTEACQTINMPDNAQEALNAAFGMDHPWQNGLSDLPTVVVHTDAQLREALTKGGTTVVLGEDITVNADTTILIGKNTTARLDLAGHTLTGVSQKTDSNRNMFDVNGTNAVLTVNNGTIEYKHTGANMGWSKSTNLFDVTGGGVLNLNGVTAKNLGGSDMAFVVHLNNWGEVTLNINDSTLQSPYVAVRVFNSGNDMNNVSIYNSKLMGKYSFWVHNYTLADFGNDANKVEKQKALLNLDFENGTNELIGDIRYGMTNKEVKPGSIAAGATANELVAALDAGRDVNLLANVNYDTLNVGVPNQVNETTMYCETHNFTTTDAAEFKAHREDGQWHSTPQYTTTLKNVTIVGAEGATVDGLLITSGHHYGNVHDYVLDKDITNNSAYYSTLILENVTFKNVNFTGKVNINTSDANTKINGVTFDSCTFTTGGTADTNGAAIRYYNESATNGQVRNITVKNCKFNNCYQGVYVHNVNGVTVTNCEFNTTGHNAIALQGIDVNLETVVITGNTFANIADRVIRFNTVAQGNITIKDNVATDSGDENGEVIKANSIAPAVTTSISNNNWGAGKIVFNPELQDK